MSQVPLGTARIGGFWDYSHRAVAGPSHSTTALSPVFAGDLQKTGSNGKNTDKSGLFSRRPGKSACGAGPGCLPSDAPRKPNRFRKETRLYSPSAKDIPRVLLRGQNCSECEQREELREDENGRHSTKTESRPLLNSTTS